MPLIIPPGFAQAVYVFEWTGDSEEMVITMGHDVSDAAGDYQQAADVLYGNLASSGLVTALADVVGFIGVNLYVGQDGGPTLVYESFPGTTQGTADGTALPSNTAYLIRKRTGAAGRRGRGRVYVPGCGEGQVDNLGMVDATHLGVLQDAADTWWGYCNVDPEVPGLPLLPMVILHRSEGAGVEPAPTPITSLQVDNMVATQRQRLRR